MVRQWRYHRGLGDDGFTPGPVTKQGGTFPMWLVPDVEQHFLYAVSSPDGEAEGCVHAYDLCGGLKPVGEKQSVGGAVPCHCSVNGSTLLVANYVGGNICALPILDDGSLSHGPRSHSDAA